MTVDSKFFFPKGYITIKVGVPLEFGGTAYGGTRISKVEYTIEDGLNWTQANIVKSLDLDHVWVFWNGSITFESTGVYIIYSKATDIYNNSQPKTDTTHHDGHNSWPYLTVHVVI